MDHEPKAQDRMSGDQPVIGGAGVTAGSTVVVPLSRRAGPGGPASGPTAGPGAATGAFTIDCADCAHRDTPVCHDCVVSFIVGREPGDAVVVDADEARAVRLLSRAGLVPGVRHQAQASGL